MGYMKFPPLTVTVVFNLYPLHYDFMVKAVDEILIISVFIQIKDTR